MVLDYKTWRKKNKITLAQIYKWYRQDTGDRKTGLEEFARTLYANTKHAMCVTQITKTR